MSKPTCALITGGGSGIGQAVSRKLARTGHHVCVADRDFKAATLVAKEIGDENLSAFPLAMDVTDPRSVDAAFSQAENRFGPVDILVTSAGILKLHDLVDFPHESWHQIMNVNVTGTFLCVQRAVPQMIERGFGRIITISSVSGQRAGSGRLAYGTSKAAIDGLTRQICVELASKGITANSIAPGPVATRMTDETHQGNTMNAFNAMIPTHRFGTCDEIAAAVAFLTLPEAGYINGQTLAVDGGYLAAGVLSSKPANCAGIANTG